LKRVESIAEIIMKSG
jgi:hypothetical protein